MFIYVNTYLCAMTKTKLTLSVDSELLKSAKIQLLRRGKSLSEFTEESMQSLVSLNIISEVAKKLGFSIGYRSFDEVSLKIQKIPAGLDSSTTIREMRDDRKNRLS